MLTLSPFAEVYDSGTESSFVEQAVSQLMAMSALAQSVAVNQIWRVLFIVLFITWGSLLLPFFILVVGHRRA